MKQRPHDLAAVTFLAPCCAESPVKSISAALRVYVAGADVLTIPKIVVTDDYTDI